MAMTGRRLGLGAAALAASLVLALPAGAPAAAPDPATDIRLALERWQADFNAGRTEGICDLFASDLRYDYGSFPERDYEGICAVLHRSLGNPERRYHYELDIQEILVSGDMAIVRLLWTLTITPTKQSGEVTTVLERGLDVFWQQPDGSWKIRRFLAFEPPAG